MLGFLRFLFGLTNTNSFSADLKLWADKPRVVSVLVVDASASMRRYGETVEKAINGYIDTVKADRAHAHVMSLVTFSNDFRVEIPLTPAESVDRYHGYRTGHGTRLFQITKRVIEPMYQSWYALTPKEKANLTFRVIVITDGEDNLSPRQDYPLVLKELSILARRAGWELALLGIGVDGVGIASQMGFDSALSATIDANHDAAFVATSKAGDIATSWADHRHR